MYKRKKMSRKRSRRLFRATSGQSKAASRFHRRTYRGGI